MMYPSETKYFKSLAKRLPDQARRIADYLDEAYHQDFSEPEIYGVKSWREAVRILFDYELHGGYISHPLVVDYLLYQKELV